MAKVIGTLNSVNGKKVPVKRSVTDSKGTRPATKAENAAADKRAAARRKKKK